MIRGCKKCKIIFEEDYEICPECYSEETIVLDELLNYVDFNSVKELDFNEDKYIEYD